MLLQRGSSAAYGFDVAELLSPGSSRGSIGASLDSVSSSYASSS
jgi:hypothetical protein